MERIILQAQSASGEPLEAIFDPDHGMSLVSYRQGEIQVIDPDMPAQIIGPHYRSRLPALIPAVKDFKAEGNEDPFDNGVARYVPWQTIVNQNIIQGTLTGKDEWNGSTLAAIEGQAFTMRFKAQLTSEGLGMELSVVGDTDSLVGFQFAFWVPDGGKVISDVKPKYYQGREEHSIPSDWFYDPQHQLHFDLGQEADYTFHSMDDPLKTAVVLQTPKYRLRMTSTCKNQDNSWNLVRNPSKKYVRIEPIAAKYPIRPSLTVNALQIQLAIL